MKKVCISKGWHFVSPEGSYDVDLPHDYMIKSERRDDSASKGNRSWSLSAQVGGYTGTEGSYSKFINMPEASHVILDVDGAYMCTLISLNDHILDMHPYGYTPYLVDLSDRVRRGRNNKITLSTRNLQPSSRWYSGAGVYRDVFLWTGGETRIEPWDLFITTKEVSGNNAVIGADGCICSDAPCEAAVTYKVIDAEGNEVLKESRDYRLSQGRNEISEAFGIEDVTLWDCENPYLYKLFIEIEASGKHTDESEFSFGVRTISFDPKGGFKLNGKTVKLRGGCIHHDHGGLGAAEFPAAVKRKIAILKAAGFNSLRTSHNPPSLALLEECDRQGILVMDEIFDTWNRPKNRFDYSLFFRDWYARDISYMVLRDRNHPCVISYSTGNEIDERNGTSDGGKWARILADEIRKHDTTRPVTNAICEIRNWHGQNDPSDYCEDYLKDARADAKDDKNNFFLRTEKFIEPLDIAGYNYLYEWYEESNKRYPDRVIWGSETHALTIYDSWKAVMDNDNVIGDYCWTAYDNLGEAGAGRASWARDEYIHNIQLYDYPWRTCFQGDMDLCGFRRPQSYYREAVWFSHTEPKIFTVHPCHNGDTLTGTRWHFWDVNDSWTFGDEYLGEPVECHVYTDADEVLFELNGRAVARVTPEKAVARAFIPYEKGELKATAIYGGKADKTHVLKTVGEPFKISVKAESSRLISDGRDLCFLDIEVVDRDGNRVPDSEIELCCEVKGTGALMTLFSGNPCNEDDYGSGRCHAYLGRALAVVKARSTQPSSIYVTVKADGLCSGGVSIATEIE